jgi:hypothetical protein
MVSAGHSRGMLRSSGTCSCLEPLWRLPEVLSLSQDLFTRRFRFIKDQSMSSATQKARPSTF